LRTGAWPRLIGDGLGCQQQASGLRHQETAMTRQNSTQSYDQKKGPADLRDVVDEVEGREPARRTGRTIPEQEGCGPDVTDYPGLGAPTGTDAQSTGSDT
jgi:hypothetical protein